jgi:Flp pilus assembly pilin Flp
MDAMHVTWAKAIRRALEPVGYHAIRLCRDRSGANSIEYAIMIGVIALACVTAFTRMGSTSSGVWANIASTVGAAMK